MSFAKRHNHENKFTYKLESEIFKKLAEIIIFAKRHNHENKFTYKLESETFKKLAELDAVRIIEEYGEHDAAMSYYQASKFFGIA